MPCSEQRHSRRFVRRWPLAPSDLLDFAAHRPAALASVSQQESGVVATAPTALPWAPLTARAALFDANHVNTDSNRRINTFPGKFLLFPGFCESRMTSE